MKLLLITLLLLVSCGESIRSGSYSLNSSRNYSTTNSDTTTPIYIIGNSTSSDTTDYSTDYSTDLSDYSCTSVTSSSISVNFCSKLITGSKYELKIINGASTGVCLSHLLRTSGGFYNPESGTGYACVGSNEEASYEVTVNTSYSVFFLFEDNSYNKSSFASRASSSTNLIETSFINEMINYKSAKLITPSF